MHLWKLNFTDGYHFFPSSDLQIFEIVWSFKNKKASDIVQRFIFAKSIYLSATTQTYLSQKYLQHSRKAKYEWSLLCYHKTALLQKQFFPFHYFAESQKCNTRSSITLFLLEDIPLIKEKKSSSDKISWSYSRADTAHVLLSHTHSAYLSNWLHNNRLCIPLLRRG